MQRNEDDMLGLVRIQYHPSRGSSHHRTAVRRLQVKLATALLSVLIYLFRRYYYWTPGSELEHSSAIRRAFMCLIQRKSDDREH